MFIKMLKAALKDGVISDDEWSMLKEVDKHYGHYDKEFKDAVGDGFITQDECRKLRKLRNSIYEKAFQQAIKDGVITEDEQAFLNEIQQAADMSDEEIKAIQEKVKSGEKITLDERECE
ncbi:MAG: hypothetical protein ACE5J5_09215 [Candidatus Hydrothermarchaeales archaeon]